MFSILEEYLVIICYILRGFSAIFQNLMMRALYFILVFSIFIYVTTSVSKSGEEVQDLWNKIWYSIVFPKQSWTGCWYSQRQSQDFPEVGVPALGGGGSKHTILPNFPTNCMKLKELGCPSPPLAPPLIYYFYPFLKK